MASIDVIYALHMKPGDLYAGEKINPDASTIPVQPFARAHCLSAVTPYTDDGAKMLRLERRRVRARADPHHHAGSAAQALRRRTALFPVMPGTAFATRGGHDTMRDCNTKTGQFHPVFPAVLR